MFSLTKAILALFLAIKAVALPISGDTLTPTDDWDGKTLKCEYQLRKLYITYRFDGRGFEPDQTAAILAIRKAGKKAGLMTGWDAHIYKETSPGELWVQVSFWWYFFLLALSLLHGLSG
jgi:hypothetical protein